MWTVDWRLKITKFCNLRCRYCYEWNDLARTDRYSLENWRAVLQLIEAVHSRRQRTTERPGRSHIVWHGGEPMLLGVRYARDVLEQQWSVLGRERLDAGEFVNVLQTSLYSLSPAWVDLIREAGFEVAVSFDMAPGARMTKAGGDTEARVKANIECLAEIGAPVVGATVLAGHTAGRLRQLHDFFAERGLPLQVNLLLESPALSSDDPLHLSWSGAAAALEDLFLCWAENDFAIDVEPLRSYLATAVAHRLKLEPRPAPHDPWSGRLTVETGGDIYRAGDIQCPGTLLGNAFSQGHAELLTLDPASSVSRDELRRRVHCPACDFRAACDGAPVLEAHRTFAVGPCPVASRVINFIERYLDRYGVDPFDALGAGDGAMRRVRLSPTLGGRTMELA